MGDHAAPPGKSQVQPKASSLALARTLPTLGPLLAGRHCTAALKPSGSTPSTMPQVGLAGSPVTQPHEGRWHTRNLPGVVHTEVTRSGTPSTYPEVASHRAG